MKILLLSVNRQVNKTTTAYQKEFLRFFFTFPFCLCIVEGKNRVNRIIKQSWKKFAPTVFQGFNSNRIFSHLQKRNEKT